jgi:hypothetical protein
VLEDGKGQVVRVTSSYNKRAKFVAICDVETILPGERYRFVTVPGYTGHEDLCRLMYENGIHGSYSEWLRAIEAGDEHRAEDKERNSTICFECDAINEEEASAWTIKEREKTDDEIIADLEKRIAEAKAKLNAKEEPKKEPKDSVTQGRKAASGNEGRNEDQMNKVEELKKQTYNKNENLYLELAHICEEKRISMEALLYAIIEIGADHNLIPENPNAYTEEQHEICNFWRQVEDYAQEFQSKGYAESYLHK